MPAKDILTDGYGRVREEVHAAVTGLGPDALNTPPVPGTSSIARLVWHLTRIRDDHVADAFGRDQVRLAQGFEKRFALGLPRHDTGYGHTPEQAAGARGDSGGLLTGSYDAVHEQTLDVRRALAAKDLARVVDERWHPPVSLGVRLGSGLSDDLQHAGQAAYVRGLLRRTES
ncbi:mycothiol transferase [Streptomyces sp. KMM 9044]|uniref:mycothiol transferase n=1 Tax=Streptomyces sp. KMM 9044 TaxID=2744474 RepID=UPI002151A771|nr:DinB family protein [Streptomyces sp. KMM 9044]WAX81529.1 DinB family protein [Streptomyces sp. KMM 9044]